MKASRKQGFTLLEIMIVVMILGVLMSIAVPNFVESRTRSRASACINSLKQIDSAKEQWAMDFKKDSGATVLNTDLAPTYIKEFPTCPAGGTYTVNVIGTNPTCSYAAHVLP